MHLVVSVCCGGSRWEMHRMYAIDRDGDTYACTCARQRQSHDMEAERRRGEELIILYRFAFPSFTHKENCKRKLKRIRGSAAAPLPSPTTHTILPFRAACILPYQLIFKPKYVLQHRTTIEFAVIYNLKIINARDFTLSNGFYTDI